MRNELRDYEPKAARQWVNCVSPINLHYPRLGGFRTSVCVGDTFVYLCSQTDILYILQDLRNIGFHAKIEGIFPKKAQ